MAHVVALVKEEEEGILAISFPDFPGCVSAAGNLDDALARGALALATRVKTMAETNQALPILRTADDIRRTENLDGAIVAAIPVELPGKVVLVQISMDEHLLAELDRTARATGTTRSGKIAEAVRTSLRM